MNARPYLSVLVMAILPVCAFADYTCPDDSDTCSYVVNTGETPVVGGGGGGHTAEKSEWISAPNGKYLANGSTSMQSQNGKSPKCEIAEAGGERTRKIGGVSVKYYKKYRVFAHAETGSGLQAVGKTAHMHCRFTSEVVDLPE